MVYFKKILIAMGFFLLSFSGNAQIKIIDSLKKSIAGAQSKQEKLNAILSLCDLGYNLHPDALMDYAVRAREIAIEEKKSKEEVWAMYYQCSALTTKGLIDSSLHLADSCIAILSGKLNDQLLLASLYNQKGRCFMRKNQYKEAIDMGYRVVKEAEKVNDVLLQMKGKTLIGWAYLEMGQTKESLKWHLDAMNTATDKTVLEKYGILFANIALNYNSLGKRDSAFYYINRAILYSRRDENLFALSNSLAIQAQLFINSGQASLAEAPLKEVVEIRKLIGDPFYIVSDMSQLGLYYANNGQPEKGIAICREGIAIAENYGLDTKLLFLYSSLGENYKAAGNLEKYAETLEKIIDVKDSVFQKNSAKALAELQTKYEFEKKEKTIIGQQLAIVKKNYLLYGTIIVALIAGFMFYSMFKNYRSRQKLKLKQLLEEEKILSRQSVKLAEEKERKRIATDLHDNLGSYAAAIASNVSYIQQVGKSETALQELKVNAHSIVSELNDTIWVLKKENLSLTAISDRVKSFIQRISSSYPHISMDVSEHINTDILLPPSQAFNLYQVIKEAILNSLKHADAKNIRVCFQSEKTWKLIITDDGKGISEPDKQFGNGNGLLNMKKRSGDFDWHIEWSANKPQGTTVSIRPTTD